MCTLIIVVLSCFFYFILKIRGKCRQYKCRYILREQMTVSEPKYYCYFLRAAHSLFTHSLTRSTTIPRQKLIEIPCTRLQAFRLPPPFFSFIISGFRTKIPSNSHVKTRTRQNGAGGRTSDRILTFRCHVLLC